MNRVVYEIRKGNEITETINYAEALASDEIIRRRYDVIEPKSEEVQAKERERAEKIMKKYGIK